MISTAGVLGGFRTAGSVLGHVLRDAWGCRGAVILRTIFQAFTPHLNQLLTHSLLWVEVSGETVNGQTKI